MSKIVNHEDLGLDYAEVMESSYDEAERIGEAVPLEPWIRIMDGNVWWPNPHYSGPDVPHPESIPHIMPPHND